jgi:2-dehydro-3-deoxygluconokinase
VRFVSIGECMIEMSGGEDGQYRLGFAGDTLNTAWYARAHLPQSWTVDYFTALGEDRYSRDMLAFLERNRIGTDCIRRIADRRPGLYLIHQEHGDRHFTYWRDMSAARLLADDTAALDTALSGADLVYFSGITLAILATEARQKLLDAIARARAGGAKAAFDPNVRPVLWPDKEVMKQSFAKAAAVADFVLATFGDEVPFFGDADKQDTATRYLGYGAKEVVVRDGAEDALVANGPELVRVPAQKAGAIVDPTGAGDSFSGTYLAARLTGSGIRNAAEAAHRVAAEVIGHKGALVDPALFGKG